MQHWSAQGVKLLGKPWSNSNAHMCNLQHRSVVSSKHSSHSHEGYHCSEEPHPSSSPSLCANSVSLQMHGCVSASRSGCGGWMGQSAWQKLRLGVSMIKSRCWKDGKPSFAFSKPDEVGRWVGASAWDKPVPMLLSLHVACKEEGMMLIANYLSTIHCRVHHMQV